FRADITRVATMLYARDLTTRSYPESGTTVAFHASSHHGEDPKRKAVMAQVNRYHVSMLAYLVEKLAKTADGDGTLLDHSLILYGTNMGNSNQHSHEDAPHVLLGGANGKLKGRRHLAYPTKTVPPGNQPECRSQGGGRRGHGRRHGRRANAAGAPCGRECRPGRWGDGPALGGVPAGPGDGEPADSRRRECERGEPRRIHAARVGLHQ